MIFFSSFSYINCLPKIRRSFPRKTTIDLLCWDCKNWYHFIKKNLEQISKFIFQEVSRLVGWPNRHILEILLACRNTFVVQNHWASARLHHWGNVLMTASVFFIHYFLLIFDTQLIETRFFLFWNMFYHSFRRWWILQLLTNCLSVFHHFVELALKGLTT